MKIIRCWMCGGFFQEPPDNRQCIVGGHWTPHSSDDRPPTNFPMRCCHQFQHKLEERRA